MTLTIKQRKFISEYLKDFNATQAAIRAGYSKKSAAIIGFENIRKPNIWNEISLALKENAMSAEEVLMRLSEHGRIDMGQFAYIENLADLSNHPLARLVKKFKKQIKTTRDGDTIEYIELELYDAKSALDTLAKYHNLLKDTSLNIDVDLSDLNDNQLERIAGGEEIFTVLATSGQSGD